MLWPFTNHDPSGSQLCLPDVSLVVFCCWPGTGCLSGMQNLSLQFSPLVSWYVFSLAVYQGVFLLGNGLCIKYKRSHREARQC